MIGPTLAALALSTLAAAPTLAQGGASASAAAQPNVTTAEARRLVAWAVKRPVARGMRVGVAMADADGHLFAFERMQSAYAGYVDAAIAKKRLVGRFAIQTNDIV